MLLEGLRDGFLELVSVVAGGVQLPEQSGCLMPESRLDPRELVEVVAFEDLVETFGFSLDAADAAGLPEQRLQAPPCQLRSRCWVGAAARMLRASLEHTPCFRLAKASRIDE